MFSSKLREEEFVETKAKRTEESVSLEIRSGGDITLWTRSNFFFPIQKIKTNASPFGSISLSNIHKHWRLFVNIPHNWSLYSSRLPNQEWEHLMCVKIKEQGIWNQFCFQVLASYLLSINRFNLSDVMLFQEILIDSSNNRNSVSQ